MSVRKSFTVHALHALAPVVCALALSAGLSMALPAAARAQGTGTGNHVRVGLTFGGVATVGVSVEYVDEDRSLDLTLGTWSFRDLSTSIVVRQYFGTGDLLPFVGAGVWLVGAHPANERAGFAAVLQAPIGLDWQAFDNHYLGFDINVNRALWVRRTDPDDDLPVNHRLVPLPGVYYRWGR